MGQLFLFLNQIDSYAVCEAEVKYLAKSTATIHSDSSLAALSLYCSFMTAFITTYLLPPDY